jgi:hypothetical protein
MIQLSILIPTTSERVDMFTSLYNELHRQLEYVQTFHPTLGRVEILVDDSVKFLEGGLSIGKKREALVKRAEGRYLCFLDDDDIPAGNYLETILRLCKHDADVVTFRSFCMLKTFLSVVDMSLKYPMNDEVNPDFIVRRRPWHINPVKSHLAKVHSFSDTNYGEDWDWFEKVLRGCTTEAHTDAVLHIYRHGDHSLADKITNHVELGKKSFQEK